MPLWTPVNTSTELWLDASDSSTITIDTGVSAWNDKSGNARHASQSVTANQPQLIPTSQNGLDIIRFDGIDDSFDLVQFAQVSDQNIFFVGDTTNLGTDYRLFLNRSAATTGNLSLLFGVPGVDSYKPAIYWNGLPRAVQPSAVQSKCLLRYNFLTGSPASALTQLNAGIPVSETFTAADLTNWSSVNSTSFQQSAIDIYEIIILPPGASSNTIDIVHGYLAHKWGLESLLPAGHTYKNSPPALLTGTLTETLIADNYIISAHKVSDGTLVNRATIASGPYSIITDAEPVMLSIYPDIGSVWAASSVVALDDLVYSTDPATYPGYWKCTTAGTTGATEPIWNMSGTTNDGTAVWTFVEALTDPQIRGPLSPAAD